MRYGTERDRASFTRRAWMGITGALFTLAAVSLLPAAPAHAQQPPPSPPPMHSPPPAQAEAPAGRTIEITPTIGYQWGGTLTFTNGDVHINAAMNYGGSIGTIVRPGLFLELGYMYQGSKLIGRPRTGPDFTLFDLGTHYFQVSGLHFVPFKQSKATPYLMGGLGMTIFDPGSSKYGSFSSQTLFSMSFGGGVRVQMNPKVALRLQSRLLLPINWASGGFYFGTGGSGLTVSGGSSLPQGEATLGLSFALGH